MVVISTGWNEKGSRKAFDGRILQTLKYLRHSRFRSSFALSEKEFFYLRQKGERQIAAHAEEFILKRLQKKPGNDGRQTPWKGHPVFVAQHATATCCRKCLEKWHGIPRDRVLGEAEVRHCLEIIMAWIEMHFKDEMSGQQRRGSGVVED